MGKEYFQYKLDEKKQSCLIVSRSKQQRSAGRIGITFAYLGPPRDTSIVRMDHDHGAGRDLRSRPAGNRHPRERSRKAAIIAKKEAQRVHQLEMEVERYGQVLSLAKPKPDPASESESKSKSKSKSRK
jgi:hypothetical protein